MEGLTQTMALIIVSCFIVNIVGNIYPDTKSKHTYLTVLSVIIVFLCISPISKLLEPIKDIGSFLAEFREEAEEDMYWEEGGEYEFVSGIYREFGEAEGTTEN